MVVEAAGRTDPRLRRVVRWLSDKGLEITSGTRHVHPFNPGIWVESGALVYDPDVAHPGDLLHEAGHLAVLPSCLRLHANGDFDDVTPRIGEYMAAHPNALAFPEDPVARAMIEGGDSSAIAWAYAAALAAGVDPWLTCERGFPEEDDGRAALEALQAGTFVGIANLAASGMVASRREFPAVRRWLQP